MHRLFVGIRPPASIRALLLAAMGGISGARWQSEEQLHLTLRFVGEVDRHLASDILAALGAVHQPAFYLALNGLGLFDRRGAPETVWAGVTPQAPVQALHKKVDQALARIGIAPDQRAFLPHITLARLKPSSGTVRNLIESRGGLTSSPFRVDRFLLIESHLTPDGAVYADVEAYRLA
ncbi:MAG TPA: RNA 2',3'-cyclic phosphodiesterase [Allosphingosinicella sp.]|nr:RNA 2',3'-cyclic phosphodiesterase [Allosphingosinicella sp.]